MKIEMKKLENTGETEKEGRRASKVGGGEVGSVEKLKCNCNK